MKFGERTDAMDPDARKRAMEAVRLLLENFGLDAESEEFKDTPRRVVDMYSELWSGMQQEPPRITMFENEVSKASAEIVVLANVHFVSTCSHHLLPFVGKAHIGYKPRAKIVGISKLARVLDYYAARPQTQERLCQQTVEGLNKMLEPAGAIVLAESAHGCITCRGARKHECTMITSAFTGIFEEEAARDGFFNHLNRFK